MEADMYLPKLHDDILTIMDVIDNICSDYKITYYLTGGTLLGAIRHGGFIPWDDDLDIIMPRNDFERFVEIAEKSLPGNMELKWITNDPRYFLLYAKVCLKNTSFLQEVGKNQSDYGIFVDIFPVDSVSEYTDAVETRKKWIKKCGNLMYEKKGKANSNPIKSVLLDVIPEKLIHDIAAHYMKVENRNDCACYANYGSQYPIKRWTMQKAFFSEPVRVKFEDRIYNAPKESTKVLESIFGKKYMELPPEEKRKTHYPLYVKFSNGEEIQFQKVINKLKIQDTLSDDE